MPLPPTTPPRYDYYGVYAACRDAAWQCMLDFGVDRLPIKVLQLTRRAGIRVIKNSLVGELRPGESGVSIFDGERWIIVYDDTLPLPDCRLVTAHELGHIFLGHEYKYAARRFAHTGAKYKSEREADMFAVRLLAPACVLHELGVLDPAGIAALCGIPRNAASARARRMALLEERGRFFSSPLERDVMARFVPFVDELREGRRGLPPPASD